MVLINTNIFIYYLKNEKTTVDYFNSLKISNEEISFSFINKIELLSFPGLQKNEEIIIQNMLNEFRNIGFDKKIEEKTIDIRKRINIKIPDSIIAATAIIYNCTLVTRNVTDFSNLTDLKLNNPYDQ